MLRRHELAGPSLARALREARAHADLSREQVAARVGCSPSAVGTWEHGRDLRADRLPRLAEALGVSVETLIAWATED